MPKSRGAYRVGSDGESLEFSGIPDMRDLFPPWHDEAACRNLGDVADKLYFQEIARMKELTQGLASPATLAAVLICETCPVRRPCLRAALDPPVFETRLDEHKRMTTHTIPPRTFGVWAGSVESERWALRDRPIDEAIDLLEATAAKRLEIRLEAYWESRNKLRSYPDKPDELRPRRPTKMDRLVDALLAKRQARETAGRNDTLAAAMRELRAAPVLVQAAVAGQIDRLRCEMTECRCPHGREYFKPRGEEPFSLWAPSADRWPVPARDGGKYVVSNVRLAHVHCNNVEGARSSGARPRGPGPGRGHKGPIARYAEEHGVSRSTAWRRLRAA